MLLLLSLIACGSPVAGTWMFTLDYTEPLGDECATTVTHNYLSAYTPAAAAEDLSWSATSTSDLSSQVFFGRIEDTESGAVLVIGTEAYPGVGGKSGAWDFSWTQSTAGEDHYTHVTGYSFVNTYEDASTTRISGTVKGGTFDGTFETEPSAIDAYTESDTWSDEAAAYVGTGGLTPAGTYLLKLDSTGVEVAASNAQTAYDCSSESCTLTVQVGCSYSYDLHGELTDFVPDDSRWVEDAGQAAGAP